MLDVVMIAGSPTPNSRSSAVLIGMRTVLEEHNVRTGVITVRDLPAEDLVLGRVDSPAIQNARMLVHHAAAVVIATPIYQASYSGVLKVFLDALPQTALRGKVVLPIATGGSLAHCLALDYALHPVLAAMGATTVLHGVYVLDNQIQRNNGHTLFDPLAQERVDNAVQTLLATIPLAQHGDFI